MRGGMGELGDEVLDDLAASYDVDGAIAGGHEFF